MPKRPTTPPGFWERQEIVQALAERDMGAVIRQYRRWTGASQTDVSLLVGIPQPHVSELERGNRQVTALTMFERFADGLGIPRGLLGLAERSDDPSALPPGSDQRVINSQRDWVLTRRNLNRNRSQLTQLATRLYDPSALLGQTGILMAPEWRLPSPIELGSVKLAFKDVPAPPVTGHQDESRALRPLIAPGRQYDTYHRAMRDLDQPRLFENRLSYRLLDVERAESTSRLTLGHMRYFDMLDVGETAAHEIALASVDREGQVREERVTWDRLPFRRLIRDPFELQQYPLLLSISTLTIRRSRAGATFPMLRRGLGKVAIAGGMLSVVPTGVFQPASILPAPDSPDFDLWRNMMREYSEEFLGCPEHDGDGPPIDYETEEPFRSLSAARSAGQIRVMCLGVGIDALNLVGDVFTVAVFDADVFDGIFDNMTEMNEEGEVARFSFDDTTIDHLLVTESIAPSGAACLYLARQHHEAILG